MKVTVTGGAGFIGGNLCRRLLDHPDVTEVAVIDDLSTGSLENLEGLDVDLVEGSILDAAMLDRVCVGASTVVHLAARGSVPRSLADPVRTHLVNATGTVEVLEAARRAGGAHVVVASSSSVYGANPELPKREHLAPMPVSPYAASKLATESYALAYQRSFGLPVLAFRFFNVFGPLQPAGHDYAAVIPTFVDAALGDRPLPIHGDGCQSRDFTFVGTVTEVLTEAVVRRVTCEGPVNLAFGSRIDLLSVVALLRDILDAPLEVEHQSPRPGDVRHSQADSTRLRELFPDVEPVAFEAGLRATVEWFRSRRAARA
ncbi:NAD-dependent epimerase/dehydratase family protein [Rhabdothermincola sp.]|uniref:NAD-dependent epimerase/dehydratase family protein n=1 Tax=Rhabdothermincola sp. TaxID=2820405 RepID=UPI002FDF600C